MTEPIFDALMNPVREGEDLTRRARQFITSHIHRHNENSDQKETGMSLADDIKTDFTDGLDWVEGWVGRVKASAPAIVSKIQSYADSPVVKALEMAGEVIDPAAESVIAGWITDLASLKLGGAAAPVPAADVPAGVDAEPDPAPAPAT